MARCPHDKANLVVQVFHCVRNILTSLRSRHLNTFSGNGAEHIIKIAKVEPWLWHQCSKFPNEFQRSKKDIR